MTKRQNNENRINCSRLYDFAKSAESRSFYLPVLRWRGVERGNRESFRSGLRFALPHVLAFAVEFHEAYSDTPWAIKWTVFRRIPRTSIHPAAICAGDRGSSGRSMRSSNCTE